MKTINVNKIYTTFMGECNPFGIGAPVIFLRLQGCHLRCYKDTLGTLCDTPEGLEGKGGTPMTADQIVEELVKLREQHGISLICLTGGDPLWRDQHSLHELFFLLENRNFFTCVETSGTLRMKDFAIYPKVFWILDYKLKSAGVKQKSTVEADLKYLTGKDYIKFVVYDEADFEELCNVVPLLTDSPVNLAAGVYWNGKMTTFQLFDKLKDRSLIGNVSINLQAHKAVLRELDTVDLTEI